METWFCSVFIKNKTSFFRRLQNYKNILMIYYATRIQDPFTLLSNDYLLFNQIN